MTAEQRIERWRDATYATKGKKCGVCQHRLEEGDQYIGVRASVVCSVCIHRIAGELDEDDMRERLKRLAAEAI